MRLNLVKALKLSMTLKMETRLDSWAMKKLKSGARTTE